MNSNEAKWSKKGLKIKKNLIIIMCFFSVFPFIYYSVWMSRLNQYQINRKRDEFRWNHEIIFIWKKDIIYPENRYGISLLPFDRFLKFERVRTQSEASWWLIFQWIFVVFNYWNPKILFITILMLYWIYGIYFFKAQNFVSYFLLRHQ
mgnify:CR=1 FL=1